MDAACSVLNETSEKYMLKTYAKSGIRTIQLRSFNENSYYEKLANVLTENPGMTNDRLASYLKVNVVVMKEQIQ